MRQCLSVFFLQCWNSHVVLFQPSDGDLFDEAMDGGQVNVNGREDSSPEPFELSALVEGLAAASPRKCRTPESFLDPSAASLVDFESLIPSNPSSKTTNPFLSGNCQIYRMQK